MNVKLLIKLLGLFLILFSSALFLPAAFSLLAADRIALSLAGPAIACLCVGFIMWRSQRRYRSELDHKSTFAYLTLCWVLAALIGALPFFLSGGLNSFTDAFFESVSGFTATGISAVSEVEALPPSLILWRSLTQWIGGLAVIIIFVAMLPIMDFGTLQVIKLDSATTTQDQTAPRVRDASKKLWLFYAGFTLLAALLFHQAGLSPFEAFNHALTTISTGSFSTRTGGITAFQNSRVEYLTVAFMLISCINYTLHYRFLMLREAQALFDTEIKWFLGTLTGAVVLTTALNASGNYEQLEQAFRHSVFAVISFSSSSGISDSNYMQWPPAAQLILILLLIMGGMSGSPSGGLKCIRLVAAAKQMIKQFRQLLHPSAVLTIKANQRTIPEAVIESIWAVIFLYFVVFSIAAGILAANGLDLYTAGTTAFSSLSNCGLGLTRLADPALIQQLPVASKLTLCACMLLGRLEFFAILVLFTPGYWRR